jgi:hypothetical protein
MTNWITERVERCYIVISNYFLMNDKAHYSKQTWKMSAEMSSYWMTHIRHFLTCGELTFYCWPAKEAFSPLPDDCLYQTIYIIAVIAWLQKDAVGWPITLHSSVMWGDQSRSTAASFRHAFVQVGSLKYRTEISEDILIFEWSVLTSFMFPFGQYKSMIFWSTGMQTTDRNEKGK